MMLPDGVYVDFAHRSARSRRVKATSIAEPTELAHTITPRVARLSERQGLLERDVENSYLSREVAEAGPTDQLLAHSITHRVAEGTQAERKAFTIQPLPAIDTEENFTDTLGKVARVPLHTARGRQGSWTS